MTESGIPIPPQCCERPPLAQLDLQRYTHPGMARRRLPTGYFGAAQMEHTTSLSWGLRRKTALRQALLRASTINGLMQRRWRRMGRFGGNPPKGGRTCLLRILLQLAEGCNAYMLGRRRGLLSSSIILDLLVSFVIMSPICHISLYSRI